MDTPGKLLKAEREKKERSLEELAELLKLRVAYLKAIEEGDYLSIPGEVFIKGYIRVYADTLGLDSNYILNLYKKQITKTSLAKRPVVSKNKTFAFKPILTIASVFFLIAISLVVFTTREEEKSVTKSLRLIPERVEEEVEVTLRGRDRLVPRDPLRVIESQVLTKKEQERFSLKIAATEFTWVSVIVDSSKPIVRFLKPGEVAKWTALNGFSVKIGNAAGARLTFNGEDLGNLGPHGKVVKLVLPEDNNTQKNDG